MPTERELLALCLRWIQHPQGDAFDKAMLIEAVQAKLQPRPWVGLTDKERFEVADISDCFDDVVAAVEAKLKEKNQ
jgi:hypothetical protein